MEAKIHKIFNNNTCEKLKFHQNQLGQNSNTFRGEMRIPLEFKEGYDRAKKAM